MSVDVDRYPSVARYLETVGGLDAHPQAEAKGGILAESLVEHPIRPPRGSLGPELEALAERPPLLTDWVPEVHFNATMLAIYDEHYGATGMNAYLQWVYERNLRLFTRPAYKILFLVVSPERLLRGLEGRWAKFRRGSTLSAKQDSPKSAQVRLVHPRNLHPEPSIRAFAQAWRAGLECAGGRNVESELVSSQPTEQQYSLRWK